MRTLLLMLLITGSVYAQNTITIQGVEYQVPEGDTFSQVWGTDIPFNIMLWDKDYILVDTRYNREELNRVQRQGLGADRNQMPQLRYYVNGGNQMQGNANGQSILIPYTNADRHMSLRWYWPNRGRIVDGIQTADQPVQIGPEYWAQRN